MDKVSIVVSCCQEQDIPARGLDVTGPSREKGQQLPRCGVWHHTATSFAMAIVNWQSKLGVDKGSFAEL